MHRAVLALVLPACLALSACVGGGSSAVSALSVDPVTTAAIAPLSAESEVMSDEIVIRDLVGGLDPDDFAAALPWSNALTGSAGVISDLARIGDGSRPCRSFKTTRHSFDGVSLLKGKVCQRPDGGWDLVNLDRPEG